FLPKSRALRLRNRVVSYRDKIANAINLYGRNALEVKSALVAARPDITVVLNPLKPRRNSFEITWMDGDKEKILWTGIKKGPPRKLKFPEASVVVAALEEALKSE
uniref:Selenoprotein H n=1 Tax=Neogobius melanostomus TaxID=47308 RepID=A0A8C6TKN3_9GOBI